MVYQGVITTHAHIPYLPYGTCAHTRESNVYCMCKMLKNTGCKKRADHFLEGAFSPPLLGGQPSIPLPLCGWGDSRASRPSQRNPGSPRFTHRAPPRLLTAGARSCDPNKVRPLLPADDSQARRKAALSINYPAYGAELISQC